VPITKIEKRSDKMSETKRDVKLLDLDGSVFEERVSVPLRGAARKPPNLVVMGIPTSQRVFQWDQKSDCYRQVDVYTISLPALVGM
jgi:hypothetical protein